MSDDVPPETVESKMCTRFPRVKIGDTVEDIEEMLSQHTNQFDSIDYIYVVDDQNILQGVISIKKVFSTQDNETKVENIMKKDLVKVTPPTGQERIVYLALSHGLKALPVVDDEDHLLGIVPYDEILKTFNQEVKKDIFRFGGLFHRVGEEYTSITSSAWVMMRSRLPWLIVGVLGGTAAASVVTSFEELLSKFLVLAAFIPVLVYMSDAVGTQSEALIIRSVALDPELPLGGYIIREFKVAAMLAVVCGFLISVVAIIGWGTYFLGAVVGLSMLVSIIAAVCISTFLPLVFRRFNYDPAVATGPLATIISDITTLGIYFSMAILLLDFLNLI
ncbi:MAG: inosine 5'-monophosphate dehydrogenase [Methanobacterium sp. PtaU1.Bin097]|jgi:magnesium transporter|nr:MAG: inosine 5'-monophosphate dehydrogenase [Methanobacterium sp. PtaU1.Bin097]